MPNENQQSHLDETSYQKAESIGGADRALRDTAQKYIDRTGIKVDLNKVEQRIRDKPLPSAAIAAAAGFVIGGGLITRPGMALVALFGRRAARETAANVVTGMVRRRPR
jgi:ElaB/YqjD/DUF883 family membrane-anchored ribosome-binding protein